MNLETRMVPMELTPEYFFDLSSFTHSKIFEGVSYVWEVLEKIEDYIKQYSIPSGYKCIGNNIYVGENVIIEEYVKLTGLVVIGDGTVVESFARVKGPTIIGNNSEIMGGSYIRGSVIVGDECRIRTELKNSIIMNNSHAAHQKYIGNSIIGHHCNLGAGTVFSNLRLDKRNIKIKLNEKIYETSSKKFGTIFGDKAQTSCNITTAPGTLIRRNSWLTCDYGGFLPSGKFVKMKIEKGDIVITDNKES